MLFFPTSVCLINSMGEIIRERKRREIVVNCRVYVQTFDLIICRRIGC